MKAADRAAVADRQELAEGAVEVGVEHRASLVVVVFWSKRIGDQ
jgi:hypothetical protein